MTTGEYLDTPEGKLGRYQWRFRRRVRLEISHIEPRGKNASDADQLAFQKQVLEQLTKLRRRAFRGPTVLKMSLNTTNRTPSHVQTITKNLLDLLSQPWGALGTSRRGLLYMDDGQVQALSVSCRHGQLKPRIAITAMPLRFFLADLDLAMHARTELASEDDTQPHAYNDDAFEDLRNLVRNAKIERKHFGQETYNAILDFRRHQAQKQLLGGSRISLAALGYLFKVVGVQLSKKDSVLDDLYTAWESMFRSTPLRILLAELPQQKGSSNLYRHQVEEKFREFQDEFSWIVTPLRIPVALEVVIKPPPLSRTRGVHDLDNILRDYIIPKTVDVLQPPSDLLWTINLDALKKRNPQIYNDWKRRKKRLPASTRVGVTRYEVWKLPRANNDQSRGFVSVAVVADMPPVDDILDRIDETIERWEKQID